MAGCWAPNRSPHLSLLSLSASTTCTLSIFSISSSTFRACVYLWCIHIVDHPGYCRWLNSKIAAHPNARDIDNVRRFVRLLHTAEKCTGGYMYYFGCTSDIVRRYGDDGSWAFRSSQFHRVHAAASHPSFSFFYGAVSASTAATQYELEKQLGDVVGVTKEALAARCIINKSQLGHTFRTYSALLVDRQKLSQAAFVYFNTHSGNNGRRSLHIWRTRTASARPHLPSQLCDRPPHATS